MISLDRTFFADMELVLLVGVLLFFALVGVIWRRWLKATWNHRVLSLAVLLLALPLTAATAFGRGIILDETVHTHAAWLMAHGKLPYVDFWDNHPPAHWLAVSLLMRVVPPQVWVLDLIRLLSLALSGVAVALALLLTSRVWIEKQVALLGALLVVGQMTLLEFFYLRADLFANALTMGALCVLAFRRRALAFWGSGVLLGLALSFTPRHWVYALVVPALLLWGREHYTSRLRLASLHYLGVGVGLLPLLAWLWSKGLLEECYHWSIQFHADMGMLIGGTYPLIPTALGIWGAVLLMRAEPWRSGHAGKVVVLALFLAALGYFTQPNAKYTYGEQMFGLLAAVAGAGPAYAAVRRLVSARRTVLVCVLIGVYLWPVIYASQNWQRHAYYLRDRKEHQTLLDLAGGEPVVCIAPWHPVFAPDATYLSHWCQYYSYSHKPEIRATLQGMPEQILRKRPVLISNEAMQRFGEIGIFSPMESAALAAFLNEGYVKMTVGKHDYWVRRDRIAGGKSNQAEAAAQSAADSARGAGIGATRASER